MGEKVRGREGERTSVRLHRGEEERKWEAEAESERSISQVWFISRY